MRNLCILALLAFSLSGVRAAENFCEALNLVNCEPVHKMTRRSSSRSAPSTTTAAQFNPANVSHDRGVGVETFYQPSQPPTFSFVTGTGKAGAALISSRLENTFFGNRVIELEDDYYSREKEKEQYKSNKYSLGLGGALFKRRNIGFDLGLIFKYNTDIKRINPGAGAALRIGPVSLGASIYQDDVFLKFRDLINPRTNLSYASSWGETYQEKFTVQSYFAGVQFKQLFLDAGIIKTHYKFFEDDVSIKLYSASYIWKKFLFNMAYRQETSPFYVYKNNSYVPQENKNDIYGGVQYSLNKYIVLGAHYNYYLLDEVSASLVIFI